MKIVQVVPRRDSGQRLKSLLKQTERDLRGKGTTLIRKAEGRWVHAKYPGWIRWSEAKGGILVAEIQSRAEDSDWKLLTAFIGYLDRHLGHAIESISITYR